MEKLLGHLTFIALMCRETLAVFDWIYKFVRQDNIPCKLPAEVVRELQIFRSLIPLIHRSLHMPWSSVVHCVDASPWGMGVLAADGSVDQLQKAARAQDRWFFKKEHGYSLRDVDLQLVDVDPKLLDIPPVEDELIQLPWKVCASRPWTKFFHIVAHQAMTIAWAVRHHLRSARAVGSHCLDCLRAESG